RFERQKRVSSGSAPGIAQLLGKPLWAGRGLQIEGRVPRRAFIMLKLRRGRRITVVQIRGSAMRLGATRQVLRYLRSPTVKLRLGQGGAVTPTTIASVRLPSHR